MCGRRPQSEVKREIAMSSEAMSKAYAYLARAIQFAAKASVQTWARINAAIARLSALVAA